MLLQQHVILGVGYKVDPSLAVYRGRHEIVWEGSINFRAALNVE